MILAAQRLAYIAIEIEPHHVERGCTVSIPFFGRLRTPPAETDRHQHAVIADDQESGEQHGAANYTMGEPE